MTVGTDQWNHTSIGGQVRRNLLFLSKQFRVEARAVSKNETRLMWPTSSLGTFQILRQRILGLFGPPSKKMLKIHLEFFVKNKMEKRKRKSEKKRKKIRKKKKRKKTMCSFFLALTESCSLQLQRWGPSALQKMLKIHLKLFVKKEKGRGESIQPKMGNENKEEKKWKTTKLKIPPPKN